MKQNSYVMKVWTRSTESKEILKASILYKMQFHPGIHLYIAKIYPDKFLWLRMEAIIRSSWIMLHF